MNFNVMSDFWIFMLTILGLAFCGLFFSISMQLYDTKGELKSAEKEIERAEELLNLKNSEFKAYKKNVAFERNEIAEGFVKSLFVLENDPKFPKGYDCEDFVVLQVEPKIFKKLNINLDDAKKEKEKYNVILATLIAFANFKDHLTPRKLNLQEIEKLRPEVYYSYKVFSKLDKKEMVVREEYLEELIKNKN